MIVYSYDGTFEGLLTLVFESYRRRQIPDMIVSSVEKLSNLFTDHVFIAAEEEKADRVWKKIIEKTSRENACRLFIVFLSELPETADLIFRYIRLALTSVHNIETDFALQPVLEVSKIHRKVLREVHRVKMFTRFQQTAENTFYASFAPKYNVIPLCVPHFRDRFAGQAWILYDLKRNFGFFHQEGKTERITFQSLAVSAVNGMLEEQLLHADEIRFRQLWKAYFHSVNNSSRYNPRLHRQLLPKRFWKYLPEKQ